MIVKRLFIGVGAVIALYVICWHLVLGTILVGGLAQGAGTLSEAGAAYAHDITQIFRVGGDELVDFVQRIAVLLTIMSAVVLGLFYRARRRRVRASGGG